MSPSVDRAAGKFDVGDEALAAEPAAGQRDHHGFELHAGHALGDVDGLADHLLGLDQVDHARRPSCRSPRYGRSRGCCTPWLRRRSTSCGACGSSRAIRQTILLVPTSRAATTAERRGDTGFIFGVRPKRSTVMPRLPCLSSWLLVGGLERLVARRGGGVRQPHGDAVGQPQIDGGDVARQQLLVAVELDQSLRAPAPARVSGSRTSMPLFRRRFQRRSATSIDGLDRCARSSG